MTEKTKRVISFYAGLIHGDITIGLYATIPWNVCPNGAILWINRTYWDNSPGWYRSDLTPVLDADVPPELKAYILLLGV